MPPTSTILIWTAFIGLAAGFGLFFDVLGRLIWKIKDLGRVWIITVPTTPGAMGRIERIKLKRGENEKRAPNGDEKERTIMHGQASYPTNRGPMHILTEYGANLVAPTKEEAIEAGELTSMQVRAQEAKTELAEAQATGEPLEQTRKDALLDQVRRYVRFRVWDPLTYWRATRENDMEDLYAAQKEREHWAVKLAPLAILLVIFLMGTLVFVLWKIMPLLSRAGAN